MVYAPNRHLVTLVAALAVPWGAQSQCVVSGDAGFADETVADGASQTGDCAQSLNDATHYQAGQALATRLCTGTTIGAIDYSACYASAVDAAYTRCAPEGSWAEQFAADGAPVTATLDCAVHDGSLYNAGDNAERVCTFGTGWGSPTTSNCVNVMDFSVPPIDLATRHEQYPNRYYINLVENNANRNIHLGYLKCPGEKVCPKHWVGNGFCDDCFGCDRMMVSIGMIGDCSTCDYFWSGGEVDSGVFDGGDCDEFVFPTAFVEAYFDQCLEGAGFMTANELAGTTFNNKRNTIINKLNDGGWGDIETLQLVPNMELAARCQYANLEQCLRKNGWWYPTMTAWQEGDLRFEVATNADSATEYQSVDLVHMTSKDLLEQCVIAGLHQRMLSRNWEAENALNAMTADDKRNKVIVRLFNAGSGTVAQLQTLSNTALLMLVDYLAEDGDVDCVGDWAACDVNCVKTYAITTAQAGAGHVCDYADGATYACTSGEGACP